MSRIAVVSTLRLGGYWSQPELINDYCHDDECMAKGMAEREAKNALYGLGPDVPFFMEILVCPVLEGLGRGCSDQYEVDNPSYKITIGIE